METTIKKEKVISKVIRVKISDIIEDPRHSTVYTLNGKEEIAASIKEVGQLNPVHLNEKYEMQDGYLRMAALKLLNATEIDAIIVENRDTEDFIFHLIHSNKFRPRTADVKIKEIEALRKYYGNRRGFRSDRKTSSMNFKRGQTTIKKISEDTNMKTCEIQKLEKIAKHNRTYLKDIDGGETLDQVYQRVTREKKEKESTSTIRRFVRTAKKIIATIGLWFQIYIKSCIFMSEVANESIQCICCSPPYYKMRKYSDDPDELGQEESIQDYIQRLALHFKDCYRVLKPRGSMFIVISDKIMNKRQQLIPELLAIELKKYGFELHQRTIWRKTTSMYTGDNSSFTPQCESILWMVKSGDFDYYDVTVPIKTKNLKTGSYCHKNIDGTLRKGSPINVKAKSKNMRDFIDDEVIESASCNKISQFLPKGTNHPAPYPVALVNILLSKVCKPGETVLDPFCGSGTTGEAALLKGCNFIGYELYANYANMAKYRLQNILQHLVSLSYKKKTKVVSIEPVQPMRKAA